MEEVKCTIIGNPDWEKGQKIFEEQLNKDIAAGKLNLDFTKSKKSVG